LLLHYNNINRMNQSLKTTSRKKILLWGAALVSSITLLKFIPGSKQKKSKTVKMLTQDGKLVEIDVDRIKKNGKKISHDEIHDWIKPQQNS
jgi:hypothetical protein